jgi:hypothetical protein
MSCAPPSLASNIMRSSATTTRQQVASDSFRTYCGSDPLGFVGGLYVSPPSSLTHTTACSSKNNLDMSARAPCAGPSPG